MSNKIAILIFANTANVDAANKPVANTFAKNIKLFEVLNNKIEAKVAKTNIPYFVYNDKNQVGSTFGQKIANAATAIFEQAFEQIIIVGNDCPQLTTNHFLKTQKLLQQGKNVIGKNNNGGVYLLGIQSKAFNKKTFANYSWQTNYLFKEIKISLNANLFQLPVLNDLNNKNDALRLIKLAPFITFSLLLSSILFTQIIIKKSIVFFKLIIATNSYKPLRAPPCYLYY